MIKFLETLIKFQKILFPLTIVFIILKMVDTIEWSWWIVFSPMLLSLGILCISLVSFFILNRKTDMNKEFDKFIDKMNKSSKNQQHEILNSFLSKLFIQMNENEREKLINDIKNLNNVKDIEQLKSVLLKYIK